MARNLLKPSSLRPGANLAILSPAGSPKPEKVHRASPLSKPSATAPPSTPTPSLRARCFMREPSPSASPTSTPPSPTPPPTPSSARAAAGAPPSCSPISISTSSARTQSPSSATPTTPASTRSSSKPSASSPSTPPWSPPTSPVSTATTPSAGPTPSPVLPPGPSPSPTVSAPSRPGYATGQLRGGCLSIYTESLGTPYAPSVPTHPTILFLEDIGTKPYQWDRLLLHLRYAGHLAQAQAIVFGDMSQNVPPEEEPFLDRVLLHNLRDFPGPIAIGLRCGHVDAPNITLPLGIQARLDLTTAANPRLTLLEPATTP